MLAKCRRKLQSATFRNDRGNKVLVTWPTFELTTASESSFVPPFLPLVVSCEALPSFVISNEAFPSFVVSNEAFPRLSFRTKPSPPCHFERSAQGNGNGCKHEAKTRNPGSCLMRLLAIIKQVHPQGFLISAAGCVYM